jgi:hypothetical protein
MRRPAALWRELGPAGFTIFQLIVGGNVLAALIYPAFAALVAYRLIADEKVFDAGVGGLHVVALIGGWAASAFSQLVGLARRDLISSGWIIATAPLHWMLLSMAAWRGVVQLVRDPYRWEKTEHGLARSSLRARTLSAQPHPADRPRNTSAGRRPRPRRFA